ncbi:hypothetical protein H1C71_015371 [Ictidomys tridecemlineatus]|nr:hypothetical protein H1C71_015371 [Ictidomys tridecemlineatus]
MVLDARLTEQGLISWLSSKVNKEEESPRGPAQLPQDPLQPPTMATWGVQNLPSFLRQPHDPGLTPLSSSGFDPAPHTGRPAGPPTSRLLCEAETPVSTQGAVEARGVVSA